MIDQRIIEMLDSPNVADRVRAVKALAKSGDRDALTYLADVYRYDDDPDVRELARKAGVYINKSAPKAAAPPSASSGLYDDDDDDDDAADDYSYGSLYAEDDDDEDDDYAADIPDEPDVPLPSEIKVSAGEKQRAQGYVDSAMDLNIRGDNAKAAESLARAIKINPQLMYDKYALSLAATITGMDGQSAMQRLAPSPDELRNRIKRSGSGIESSSPVQAAIAGLMMVCAAVALVGYFFFPWVDIGGLEVDSAGNTFEDVMNMSAEAQMASGLGIAQAELEIANAVIDAIELSPNGFATTQYSSGMINVLEYFGIINAIKVGVDAFLADAGGGFGVSSSEIDNLIDETIDETIAQAGISLSLEAEPLDFSLWIVPIMAIIGGIFGIVVLQGATFGKWTIIAVIGLITVLPMIYFYANGIDSLFERTIAMGTNAFVDAGGLDAVGGLGFGDLGDLTGGVDVSGDQVTDTINQFNGTDLIGLGFWITLVGILGVTLLPFIGMLFMPTNTE